MIEKKYVIEVYKSPISKKIAAEIYDMCLSNNFNININQLFELGSFLAVVKFHGKIIASRRFKENKFKNLNEQIKSIQCCETITDKLHRGKGLFSALWNEVKPHLISEYQYIYNFPNSESIKPYIKNGFKIQDEMITFAIRAEMRFLEDKLRTTYFDECLDVCSQAFSKIYLKNGIHRYVPITIFGKYNDQVQAQNEIKIFGCSMNSLKTFHDINFIKTIYFNARPITFYPMSNTVNLSEIYLSPASYDTVK